MTETQPWENPVLIIASAVFIVVWIFTLVLALMKLSTHQPPALLVLSLSMLTLLSIVGGIFTGQDAPWSIAAAGIGALAGSVSAMYGQTTKVIYMRRDDPPSPEEVQSDDDQ